MFRQMQQMKKALSREECIRILTQQPRGVLSVLGDNGYPYGLPIDHWYSQEDGMIYFHCGKEGHKLDALRACDKVSFCVFDEGCRDRGDWALNIRSVIVFGRIRILDDPERCIHIVRQLSRKFTDDEGFINGEIEKYGAEVLCLQLCPEHICGKKIREA